MSRYTSPFETAAADEEKPQPTRTEPKPKYQINMEPEPIFDPHRLFSDLDDEPEMPAAAEEVIEEASAAAEEAIEEAPAAPEAAIEEAPAAAEDALPEEAPAPEEAEPAAFAGLGIVEHGPLPDCGANAWRCIRAP